MKKSMAHCLVAGALVAAPLPLAAPASAQAVACGIYQPGLLAYLAPTRPAPCSYQGDRIAHQGPTFDGPAVVAPQNTYSPSRTVAFGYYPYRAQRQAVVHRTAVRRSKRVSVDDGTADNGKVEVVRARAEVRIYSPERMDIRLYRR